MTKQDLVKWVESLPDDTPFDKLQTQLEKLYFLAEVQTGIDELDRGEGIPHEEVLKSLSHWLED